MAEDTAQQRLGGQPVLIMSDESERTQGDDAQSMNLAAGQAVAEAVRTTLGPKGMNKMLVDDTGDVVVTNDGVTILQEMDIEHPAAGMVVDVAETQAEETGDGTTSAVLIAGELLEEAETLLERDIHPQTIVSGYLDAANFTKAQLEERAIEVDLSTTETLEAVARTAIAGKIPAGDVETFVDVAVRSVRAITDDGDVDLDSLAIETVTGGAAADSKLVDGVTVDKDPVHANMPDRVEDARIALIDTGIDVEDPETDLDATVTDPDQLQEFIDREEAQLRDLVDTITATGANVVFADGGIDDVAQQFLAQEGVLAVRRTKDSDMTHLAKATGATIVGEIDDLSAAALGRAGRIERRDVGDDERLFVEDCENPRSVTLLLRGGTDHVVEDSERALEDALDVVARAIEDGHVVPGGGAIETELALAVREYADGVEGREQLAVESFADALEAVPETLAQTSGLDPIDALVDLRSRHATGDGTAGLDIESGELVDMVDDGVIEPLGVKRSAIASAQEAANVIVRIDDVITGLEGDEDDGPGGGGPGGPGGAPGGMPGGGMGGL